MPISQDELYGLLVVDRRITEVYATWIQSELVGSEFSSSPVADRQPNGQEIYDALQLTGTAVSLSMAQSGHRQERTKTTCSR